VIRRSVSLFCEFPCSLYFFLYAAAFFPLRACRVSHHGENPPSPKCALLVLATEIFFCLLPTRNEDVSLWSPIPLPSCRYGHRGWSQRQKSPPFLLGCRKMRARFLRPRSLPNIAVRISPCTQNRLNEGVPPQYLNLFSYPSSMRRGRCQSQETASPFLLGAFSVSLFVGLLSFSNV